MRPGRQLAVLGLLFVILYSMVLFLGTKGQSMADRFQPKLGLDLVGGTRVALKAATLDGGAPSEASLAEARRIIEGRVNGLGVTEAEVVTEGNDTIVISLAGEANDQLKDLADTAELRFRKVLKVTQDVAASVDASPSPSPSGTASPTASATPSAAASPTASPAAATPTPSGTASPTPSGSTTPDATGAALLEQVKRKVGAQQWAAAAALTGPDPAKAGQLSAFGRLSPAEVAVLPAQMQFNVPTIGCEQLDDRPVGSIRDPDQRVVACESGAKYLLDKAKVLGTDVSSASAQVDSERGGYLVDLDFTSDGQKKWTALTREAYRNSAPKDEDKCAQDALGDEGNCRVSVVLDNEIVSSPEILAVLTGNSQITGSFTNSQATTLANQLKYGALPLSFTPSTAQTVSATLGTEHLKAGLLAAGIGMLLVIIYGFFYYRLLGTVIFLSLILSALLIFGALIVLGRQIGFTLTLAGIAGFIVSLGVAADSFVIYFERLKDEIRDGRSPRSAIPRAWARARRTIISANAISIMAAVVLYLVSTGTVRGFAFALGLATILDLVVVFLFRHPIMAMFARTKAFLSPRVSGLGRVLEQDRDDAAAPANRGPRVKEA